MNKDELVKYKEYLLKKSNRKYGFYDHSNKFVEIDDLQTVNEIVSSIDMNNVIKQFELFLKNSFKYLNENGIDFDRIELFIPADLYASESFLKKCSKGRERDLVIPLQKKDVLYGVVPLRVWLTAYDSNGCDVFPRFFLGNEREFFEFAVAAVEYNKFVELVAELGYDISLKNFDEYFDAALSASGPKINISFSKEIGKTR